MPGDAESVRPPIDDRERMPGWVKAFIAAAILLVLAFVILHLTGKAPTGHGP